MIPVTIAVTPILAIPKPIQLYPPRAASKARIRLPVSGDVTPLFTPYRHAPVQAYEHAFSLRLASTLNLPISITRLTAEESEITPDSFSRHRALRERCGVDSLFP